MTGSVGYEGSEVIIGVVIMWVMLEGDISPGKRGIKLLLHDIRKCAERYRFITTSYTVVCMVGYMSQNLE